MLTHNLVMLKNYLFTSIFSLVIIASGLLLPDAVFADDTKTKYFRAESSYYRLKKSPKKQKYRDNWLKCIAKFQSVYRHDPSSQWAPAGLYMSGKLYMELYRRSYKSSDKKEAIDIFNRLIKRYPRSSYRKRAAVALKEVTRNKSKTAAKKQTAIKKKTVRATKKKIPVKKPLFKKKDSIAKIIEQSSLNKKTPVKASHKGKIRHGPDIFRVFQGAAIGWLWQPPG